MNINFKLSCMFSQKTAILIHFYQAYVRLYPFYFLPLCVVFLAADDTEYVTIFWHLKRKNGHIGKALWVVPVYILRGYRAVSRIIIFSLWRCNPTRAMASSFLRFRDHTQRRITVGRTPLDEWSARRRDLYLTTHNTHNRQTTMPPVGFEHTISAGERPQTYALDRAATGTGCCACRQQ
jgi:hypothetical protein